MLIVTRYADYRNQVEQNEIFVNAIKERIYDKMHNFKRITTGDRRVTAEENY